MSTSDEDRFLQAVAGKDLPTDLDAPARLGSELRIALSRSPEERARRIAAARAVLQSRELSQATTLLDQAFAEEFKDLELDQPVAPRPRTTSPVHQLLGWLGIQVGGDGMAVSPAAALALALLVGGAAYFAAASRQVAGMRGDVLRSGDKLEIETANPVARCQAIEAALIAAKLAKGTQVVVSLDNEQACRVVAFNLDEVADRDAAAVIFRALGFPVEPQARLEVAVRKSQ